MKISVILPNYNGAALLRKNLPRLVAILSKIKTYQFELIMVDDGSLDDSVSYLTEFATKKISNILFILVTNSQNKGFSHTVNSGIKKATGEYVVFLNTDVIPEDDFLEAALPHFNNDAVFGVAFMDKSVEGEKVVYRGRGLGRWERGFYIHVRGEVHKNDTDWISGGSGIVRRSMLIDLHGFNEIYDPFYWEDIDLSYRAKKRGWKLVFERNSVVVHKHEIGAIRSKYSQDDIITISYRNQFLFVWNNATVSELLTHIAWFPFHLYKALKRKDLFFIKGLWQAVIRKLSFPSYSHA